MSEGIIENIYAELRKMNVALAVLAAVQDHATTKTADKPATSKPAAAKGKAKISKTDLTALVQPMVQDDDLKGKVKDVLTSFGLARLGEAKEEQYAALHEAFSALTAEGGDDAGEDDGLL